MENLWDSVNLAVGGELVVYYFDVHSFTDELDSDETERVETMLNTFA